MIEPLNDFVVILPEKEVEKKSKGGVWLPEREESKKLTGTVVAVGPGRVLNDGRVVVPDVAPGDVVIFAKYAGTEVEIDERAFIVIPENAILVVTQRVSRETPVAAVALEKPAPADCEPLNMER